jgi:hypothetical protein
MFFLKQQRNIGAKILIVAQCTITTATPFETLETNKVNLLFLN